MQARTVLGVGAFVGVVGLVVTQMGFNAQDRQYKKTLQYMHDGRDKIEGKMKQGAKQASDAAKELAGKK